MNIDIRFICTSIPQPVDHRSAVALTRNLRFVLAALALTSWSALAGAQVPPSDAWSTCTVTPAEFDAWFANGHRAADGKVNPADGLEFRDGDSDCNFHKWAEQMFLWVTSPTDSGVRVFGSPEFFTVSAPAQDRSRTLTQNVDILVRTSKPVKQPGEAGDSRVLMARNKSLVYYVTQVNDVYAYFRTGQKTHEIAVDPLKFPITSDALKKITDFAGRRGITFPHPQALAIEVKSAWVEVSGLQTVGLDVSKYVTITATIPKYKKSDSTWTRLNTSKGAQLALVGMHVVGSVAGHAEMVWSTFEHIDNAPGASYTYCKDDPCTPRPPVELQPGRAWLFSADNNCTDLKNKARMRATSNGDIEAIPFPDGSTIIEPSDACRLNAWGSRPDDPEAPAKNTQVIKLNSSIMELLGSGDVRKNYMLIGTTWGPGLGARALANTTLETFVQHQNCSDCHSGNLHDNPSDNGLSHIYQWLNPLP